MATSQVRFKWINYKLINLIKCLQELQEFHVIQKLRLKKSSRNIWQ